ncbi:MAG: hypothetical protein FVQ83_02315 [Chloroflexi bacterium]|nr:hypothetical protein [Chloroflexota bacterium]
MENPTQPSVTNGSGPSLDPIPDETRQKRLNAIGAAVIGLVVLAILVGSVIFLLQPTTPTSTIRDIVIIGLAVELLVLGLALVVSIVQLARLINLVQNEVQPVLESANETINTLRGTATFLSDNLVQPLVKVNGYVSAIRRALSLVNLRKKKQ